MKLFADMHVHSKFSVDGTSTMEEYCLAAEKTGSRIICFTEHVDFNSMEKNLSIIKDNRTQNFVVDDYFCEINRLRKKYSSLTLLSGIEFSEPHLFPHEFAKYCAYPFDCITAGIHHCNNAVFPGARNLLLFLSQPLHTNGAFKSKGHGSSKRVCPLVYDCKCSFTSRETVVWFFPILLPIALKVIPFARHSCISMRSSRIRCLLFRSLFCICLRTSFLKLNATTFSFSW